MAERKITNNSILLFLGEDAEDLDTVVCLTSIKQDFTIDEVDATTICGVDKSAGELSGNISFEGQHLLDPVTGKVSGHSIFEWMVAKTVLYYQIGPAIPAEGDVIQDGVCFISSMGNAYSLNSQSSFSATLTIKGVPTETIFEEVDEEVIPMDGLWAWYDSAVGVTGTTNVTTWADQSGNGHDLIATGSPAYPTLVTGAVNGEPVVSSFGLDSRMSTVANFPDCSAGGTIIIVGAQSDNGTPGADSGGVFVSSSSSNNMLLRRGNSSTSDVDGVHWSIRGGFDTSTQAVSPDVVIDEDFATLTLLYDGTENKLEINDAGYGTPVTADGSGYFASVFNMFKNGGSARGYKQIAFCAVYTRTLTTDEIDGIKTYLQTRYAHY